MRNKWYIITLLGLGLLTRFLFFGHPNETVFDEVHFGKFVSAYYTKEFYFDIHPPLGKQIIAGFAKLSDFKPEFAFAEIGEKFPNKQYMILRFLPSLASSLLPLVIYLLLLELGISRFAAFMGGLFIVFENAFLTQGRYILMDSFMLLFGFLSLLFYFKYKKLQATRYLLYAGVSSGLALSIKWLALSFVALPLAVEGLALLSLLREHGFKSLPFAKIGKLAGALILLPLLIYFSVFVVEFSLLTKSGAGDAFLNPGFQKSLQGNKFENDSATKDSNLFQKFFELNAEMYKANQRLTATHPYSSQWYSWPLMTRSIYYWVNPVRSPICILYIGRCLWHLTSNGVNDNARIYLIGNPVIWWSSTAAISYLVFSILYLVFRKLNTRYTIHDTRYLLLAGYVINMLPFIGVKRVMFLYHYFTAYIFAIIMLVWLISQNKNSETIFRVLLVVGVIAFVYFAPLSYGLELSPKAYEARVWLDSWK
ncbi:MAG: phospholipid carrier-dependent glycosyltransferase [Candidatus Taylorbacteria bacterium]|nr:phospholipid carrier-dependent glycosyltransferase [Candidatus Taylorbacteria bacterium]